MSNTNTSRVLSSSWLETSLSANLTFYVIKTGCWCNEVIWRWRVCLNESIELTSSLMGDDQLQQRWRLATPLGARKTCCDWLQQSGRMLETHPEWLRAGSCSADRSKFDPPLGHNSVNSVLSHAHLINVPSCKSINKWELLQDCWHLVIMFINDRGSLTITALYKSTYLLTYLTVNGRSKLNYKTLKVINTMTTRVSSVYSVVEKQSFLKATS